MRERERACLPPFPSHCQRDGSDDYMALINKRAQDNSFAQKEREKRRRKVLMDQMRALRSQEVGGSGSEWVRDATGTGQFVCLLGSGCG